MTQAEERRMAPENVNYIRIPPMIKAKEQQKGAPVDRNPHHRNG